MPEMKMAERRFEVAASVAVYSGEDVLPGDSPAL